MKRFKQHLSEVYSKENIWLLQYMRQEGLDLTVFKPSIFTYWIRDNHPEVSMEKISSPLDPVEFWEDVFEHIPKNIRIEFQNYVDDNSDQWFKWIDNYEFQSLTKASMSLSRDKLLKRTTWLVHFTHNEMGILRNGFKGTDDIVRLALTSYGSKDYEGYNFAFIADSRDADNVSRSGKYGDQALMFQNSGVNAYHYGDGEEQIMFWGADVDKKKFVLLSKWERSWYVVGNHKYKGHPNSGYEYPDDALFFPEGGGYEECVEWVQKNHKQYRKVIYQ